MFNALVVSGPLLPTCRLTFTDLANFFEARYWPAVAVGTTIADRPPHRSVRARLRIRLLPRMNGVEALVRIRMQNMRVRNPPVHQGVETIPSNLRALTATESGWLRSSTSSRQSFNTGSIIVRGTSAHGSRRLCRATTNTMLCPETPVSCASSGVAYADYGGASWSVAVNARRWDGIVSTHC
jgi:hypothetical protein